MTESAATREMDPPDGPHPTVGAHAAGEGRARGVSSPTSASHCGCGALLTALLCSQCIARCLMAWIRFVPDSNSHLLVGPPRSRPGCGCLLTVAKLMAARIRAVSVQQRPRLCVPRRRVQHGSDTIPRAFFDLLDPGWDCGGGGKCFCDARGGRGPGAPGGRRCCVPQAGPPRGGVAAAPHSHALKGYSSPRETRGSLAEQAIGDPPNLLQTRAL